MYLYSYKMIYSFVSIIQCTVYNNTNIYIMSESALNKLLTLSANIMDSKNCFVY